MPMSDNFHSDPPTGFEDSMPVTGIPGPKYWNPLGDEELWSRYFAAAIASQEHIGATAVQLADAALKQHRERWPR